MFRMKVTGSLATLSASDATSCPNGRTTRLSTTSPFGSTRRTLTIRPTPTSTSTITDRCYAPPKLHKKCPSSTRTWLLSRQRRARCPSAYSTAIKARPICANSAPTSFETTAPCSSAATLTRPQALPRSSAATASVSSWWSPTSGWLSEETCLVLWQ